MGLYLSRVDGIYHTEPVSTGRQGKAIGRGNPSTTDTEGYLQIPVMQGAPTGVPNPASGYSPILIDEINHKLAWWSSSKSTWLDNQYNDLLTGNVWSNVKAQQFGATGDGNTSDNAALASADSAQGNHFRVYPAGTYRITTNMTLTKPIWMLPGAMFSVNSGVTLTINGILQAKPMQQLFSGTGTVVLGTKTIDMLYSEWWGAGTTSDDTLSVAKARIAAVFSGAIMAHIPGTTYNLKYYLVQSGMTILAPNAIFRHIGNTSDQLTFTPTYGFGTPSPVMTLGNPLIVVVPADGNNLSPTLAPGGISSMSHIRWYGPTQFYAKQSFTDPTTALMYMAGTQEQTVFQQLDFTCGRGDGYNVDPNSRYGNYGLYIQARAWSGVQHVTFQDCRFRQANTFGVCIDTWDSQRSPTSGCFGGPIYFKECSAIFNGDPTATRNSSNQMPNSGGLEIRGGVGIHLEGGHYESNQGPGIKLGPWAQYPIMTCWLENNNNYIGASASDAYPNFYTDITTDVTNNSYTRGLGGSFNGVAHEPGKGTYDTNPDGTNEIKWWAEFRAHGSNAVHYSGGRFIHSINSAIRDSSGQLITQSQVMGDTYQRYNQSANGTSSFGPGNAALDTDGWARAGVGQLYLTSATQAQTLGGLKLGKDLMLSVQSPASASTYNIDANAGVFVNLPILTQNISLYQGAVNYVNGQLLILYFKQDATGGRTVANWGSAYKVNGWQPDAAANAQSTITLMYSSGLGIWMPVSAWPALPLKKNISTKTANYTVSLLDYTLLGDTTTGSFTFTLPLASTATIGQIINIKKVDGSANTVSIVSSGSDTVDGVSSVVLESKGEAVTLQSDSTSWWII